MSQDTEKYEVSIVPLAHPPAHPPSILFYDPESPRIPKLDLGKGPKT